MTSQFKYKIAGSIRFLLKSAGIACQQVLPTNPKPNADIDEGFAIGIDFLINLLAIC